MPLLSDYARGRKLRYFRRWVPMNARILEIGCGEGWVGAALKRDGWNHYVGLNLVAPADIVGDIMKWRDLGLRESSFDAIIAFEVVEHVPCFQPAFDLLKPGGLLLLTSPVPYMDWLCLLLEKIGLNQRRTSPHVHLIYFRDVPLFEPMKIKIVAFMAQWGVFRRPK